MIKKFGFTLAEVLITLGIIGIVAVLTVPTLLKDIQTKQRAEQIRTIKYKFTKATDTMKSYGLITPYDSTEEFIAQLSKHLKIIKVCAPGYLSDCWPYEEITLSDGTRYNVNNIDNGTTFLKTQGDWSSPAMGIVMADGTPMIFTYQKDCPYLDNTQSYMWTMIDGKPESNQTASCVAGIFEINGNIGKNQFKEDVIAFNANALAGDCTVGIEANSKCFSLPFQPSVPLTKAECTSLQKDLGIGTCGHDTDWWAAAVKQCGGVDYMPKPGDLTKLASKMYKGRTYLPDSYTAKTLNISPPFVVWTEESRGAGGTGNYESHRAGGVKFTATEGTAYGWGYGRLSLSFSGIPYYAMCVAH